jgi:hypothetical protein
MLILVFIPMGYMNAFWNFHSGATFKHFGLEMDSVMGGLLRIPHWSKFEAVFAIFGIVGGISSWWTQYNTLCVCCLTIAGTYLLLCTSYAYYARQKSGGIGMFIIGLVICGAATWRRLSFSCDPVTYNSVAISCLVCWIVGTL